MTADGDDEKAPVKELGFSLAPPRSKGSDARHPAELIARAHSELNGFVRNPGIKFK